MEEQSTKQKVVEYFLKKGVLITPDLLDSAVNDLELLKGLQEKNTDLLILNKDISDSGVKSKTINWREFEKSRTLYEKNKNRQLYTTFVDFLKKEAGSKDEKEGSPNKEEKKSSVDPVFNYTQTKVTKDVQDFVKYYNIRFKQIERLLSSRSELNNLLTISRIKGKMRNKDEREEVSLIGMVSEKKFTKNGNLMLTLEDPTGSTNVLINKNKPEFFDEAKDIVYDEIIGINGVTGNNIIFANTVVWPDIPFTKEMKQCDDDVYAVFLSDLHVGSDTFLASEFAKFISWIRGEMGNEKQKEIAKKIRYLFIAGDLVDGVGIYPGQEAELVIKDIYEQYSECARYLKMIPEHVEVIVCPGNHDAMRLSEPQPIFPKDIAGPLYEIPNLTLVSNPAIINIHRKGTFSGFDVLMYHGYSFDYFVPNVESIRAGGGYHRSDLIMKFLLKRRHLAPSHESTLHVMDTEKDPLVLERIPDFVLTGHIHYSSVSTYRNITLICGSCFQGKTAFQEKMGHDPEPGRVPIVNLKTRKINILKFGD